MTQLKVNALLLIALLVMTVCPMIAAFYFVDNALTTSLNLGFNAQIVNSLEVNAQNLKELGRLDPQRKDQYRAEFEKVEALKAVYNSPELVKTGIRHSLLIYFALGVLASLLLSIAAASLLGRQISRSFRATFDELTNKRARVRYLEEMSSWQELAKMLAHEIKNPLTPIEVLVSSLSKAYLAKSHDEFRAHLSQTQAMINEELTHLKNTVNKFSEFAKLPAVHLAEENLPDLLRQHVSAIVATFDQASIHTDALETQGELRANLDATLFRQVLTNIVRNGVEANPGRRVQFAISLAVSDKSIDVTLANDGAPVPTDLAGRIFDPYVSGKSGKDNMGLGLAIVRKILIEHGGDIAYTEVQNRPTFTISLPKLA
jgi:nitrogen fixation/metabolism regulation signal transduction histidine kinase